jgi:hypothetical protein
MMRNEIRRVITCVTVPEWYNKIGTQVVVNKDGEVAEPG